MIEALVGLGNPGGEYAHTYHNVGFQAVDYLLTQYDHDPPIQRDGELFSLQDAPVEYLGKPGLYVNRSGEVVSDWAEECDWDPEQVLVVYDDFELNVGTLRIKPSGSAGGHNGMADVIEHFGTQRIPRIRIGIGPVSPGGDPAEFVLSQITSADRETFREIFRKFPTLLNTLRDEGFEATMNHWNGTEFNE